MCSYDNTLEAVLEKLIELGVPAKIDLEGILVEGFNGKIFVVEKEYIQDDTPTGRVNYFFQSLILGKVIVGAKTFKGIPGVVNKLVQNTKDRYDLITAYKKRREEEILAEESLHERLTRLQETFPEFKTAIACKNGSFCLFFDNLSNEMALIILQALKEANIMTRISALS